MGPSPGFLHHLGNYDAYFEELQKRPFVIDVSKCLPSPTAESPPRCRPEPKKKGKYLSFFIKSSP